LTRLEARIRVIRAAVKVAFILLCVAIGLVFVAKAIPKRRALEELEAKLEVEQAEERVVAAERDVRHIELNALSDPAFLEIHARDRLGYYHEGERILRFKRDQ